MNADVYQDTGTGAVGTNMFAYCNNNPVMCVDPNGNIPITKTQHQPLDIFSYLIAICYTTILLLTGSFAEPITISTPVLSKRTPIPSKLKNGKKVKTPDTHKKEFSKNGDKYNHKKTKWVFQKSKDGHYGGKNSHWHARPSNGNTGDYYNIGLDGTIL